MTKTERAVYERERYRERRGRVHVELVGFAKRQAERVRLRAEQRARINRQPLPVHSPLMWRKEADTERIGAGVKKTAAMSEAAC